MDIRAQRIAAGLSQSQLAQAAGVLQPNLSAYEHGRREPSPRVRERLERALTGRPSARIELHREEIRALVGRHNASSARTVGSVARGEDEPGSDVDLLVSFNDDASLLDETALRLALQDLLQVDVDLIADDAISGALRDRVLQEAVPV